MARPIILGVVGDSGTGKSTIARGVVDILGADNVTHVRCNDYHRYDRAERAQRGITPLHPDCNHLDVVAQHIALLRAGEPILKPTYSHADGTFGRSEYVVPKRFVVVEGLLGYHTSTLSSLYDVRVFMAPPEDLRRTWKIERDTADRGYSVAEAADQLGLRELDAATFVRPQEQRADIVVTFRPGDADDAERLDAVVRLREGLAHPDLSVIVGAGGDGITLTERGRERELQIAGSVDPTRGAAIEAAIWERMHFASHLRTDRLGVFTRQDGEHRSGSLAIVQVVVIYHLVTAKAIVALGGDDTRPPTRPVAAAPAAVA